MRTLTGAGLIVASMLISVPLAKQGVATRPALTWERCSAPPTQPCFTQRGRLSAQNGIPYTLWLVGTRRIVAVDNNEMPRLLWRYLDMSSPDHSDVYGDYEICPLEPDRPGHMRRVCLSSATRLVVQDRERARPPVRLLATWPKTR